MKILWRRILCQNPKLVLRYCSYHKAMTARSSWHAILTVHLIRKNLDGARQCDDFIVQDVVVVQNVWLSLHMDLYFHCVCVMACSREVGHIYVERHGLCICMFLADLNKFFSILPLFSPEELNYSFFCCPFHSRHL